MCVPNVCFVCVSVCLCFVNLFKVCLRVFGANVCDFVCVCLFVRVFVHVMCMCCMCVSVLLSVYIWFDFSVSV